MFPTQKKKLLQMRSTAVDERERKKDSPTSRLRLGGKRKKFPLSKENDCGSTEGSQTRRHPLPGRRAKKKKGGGRRFREPGPKQRKNSAPRTLAHRDGRQGGNLVRASSPPARKRGQSARAGGRQVDRKRASSAAEQRERRKKGPKVPASALR